MTTVSLRCKCGRVRGVADGVTPRTVQRLQCYCDDCRAFAHFLERSDLVDAAGGVGVWAMPPARIRITEGEAELRCLRLSEKGLLRWFTACCRTPVGNMVGPRVPYVGVGEGFVDADGAGRSREEIAGPAVGVQGRFATGPVPAGVDASISARNMAKIARRLAGWWIRRLGSPSPFFDARTKAPIVAPRVLTREERGALRARDRS